jgi:hypothetical protein
VTRLPHLLRTAPKLVPSDPAADTPSLDVLIDIAKARIAAQGAQFSTIDTKANFALGAASLVLVGAVGLRGALTPAMAGHRLWGIAGATGTRVVTAEMVIAAGLCLITLFLAMAAYAPRDVEEIGNLKQLEQYSLQQEAYTTKRHFLARMSGAHETNASTLGEKARRVVGALWSLRMSAAWLVVMALTPLWL